MLGIYFSGTGNSKYCLETFLQEYGGGTKLYSIEDTDIVDIIKSEKEIIFSYPVQYSNIPKILRDFIEKYQSMWEGKHIFVIATMGIFSGDGAGVLARLLEKYGARIIGGLHLKMPDSIADERVLKRSVEKNKELVRKAEQKIKRAVENIKTGRPPREGIGFFYWLTGLFGQRLYFGKMAEYYTDKLKIDEQKCIGCGICENLCPMQNITLHNHIAKGADQCTKCYRCVNRCPKQAITLLGRKVVEQSTIEKFL